VGPQGDQRGREGYLARRAIWEDVAVKARLLHCPDHYVSPWRVVVMGETSETLDLQIYGCCAKLGVLAGQLVRADPRLSGPR
jgi:hypothetical protein